MRKLLNLFGAIYRSKSTRQIRLTAGRRLAVEVLESRLTPSAYTDNQVVNLYRIFLDRVPESPALTAWSGALETGRISVGQMADRILRSPEHAGRAVTGAYEEYLGRLPETGGLAAHAVALQRGVSPERVDASILGSDEYFVRQGSGNIPYVQGLYRDVLGRDADSAGLEAHVAALARGASRTEIAQAFLTSGERGLQLAGEAYREVLGREGAEAELAGWAGVLKRSAGGSAAVWSGVAGSVEGKRTLSAPGVVRNLEVNPTGVGELTVSWERPAGFADVTAYSLTMTTSDGTGSTSSSAFTTSSTSHTFSNLSPANAYGFVVTATNAGGTSPGVNGTFGQVPLTTLDRSYALTTGQDGSIWVASVQFQTVNQITFADGVWTPQPAIGVNGEPIALTTGLDGSIWVSNLNTSNIQQITEVNGVWTVQDTISVMVDESGCFDCQGGGSNEGGTSAGNVAITTSSDGSIWVANRNYNSVQQIADTWGPWAAETPISLSDKEGYNNEGPLPNAITAGLDGSIWFANQGTDSNEGGNSVQQVTNVGGAWTAQTPIAVGTTPRAITTGLDGSIWVANTGSNTVQQIAQVNGAWVAQPAIAVGTGPRGLVAGLDGSIWVANTGSNTVQQIANVGGVWSAQQPIAAGANPFGLTVGLDGSLWVTNTGSNTLQQIVTPPSSPLDLSADTSSSFGNITLNWNAPVTNGGAPITAYTATVWQGEQTQTIQTSDTSAIFEGLSAGSGPTYFTVTAINFAGVSPAAEFLLDQAGNPVTVADARIGFTTDGDASFGPSFDDSGNSYSWDALGDTTSGGTRVGNLLLWNGVSFELGSPNQPDVLAANGQTVPVSGTGNVLTLAAAAINGGQENQQIVLTFTDSSTATWTQSFSDWCDPQNYAGESTISTQPYLNTLSGEQVSTANNVYGYSYALPEGKTLASLTLPHNVNLRVLDAAVASSTSVDLSGDFNFWGIANGQTQASNNDGFDHNGHYFYSGDLPSSLTWGGATLNFGPTSTTKDGTNNFVQAQGQSIQIPLGDFSSLYFAAAAANGSQANQAFTLHFSDGSQETWNLSLSDWCDYQSFEGQTVLHTQSNWVDQVGNVRSQTNRLYGYAYLLPAGKNLTSITLPNNHDVGILGISLG